MIENIYKYLPCVFVTAICSPSQAADKFTANDLNEFEGTSVVYSEAIGVSADGNTVVINSSPDLLDLNTSSNVPDTRAYKWTAADGFIDIGSLRTDGNGVTRSYGISPDGQTIVGQSKNDNNEYRAFSWNAVTGITDLGTLKNDNSGISNARSTTDKGTAITGQAETMSGELHAFRWDALKGMQDLGTLRADKTGRSMGLGISGDGNVIVGDSESELSSRRAFRWDTKNGIEDLGTLKKDNTGSSTAFAISSDAQTVVGQAVTDVNNTRHAFKWTRNAGMHDLGSLNADNSGESGATSVSANGDVVVGESVMGNESLRAFRWTNSTGMIDLGTLKSDNSGMSVAFDVSADGSVITGFSQNDSSFIRATLWRVMPLIKPVSPVDTPPPLVVDASPEDVKTPPTSDSSSSGSKSAIPAQEVTPAKETVPLKDPVPLSTPVIAKVDVGNALKARNQVGNETFQVLELERLALGDLKKPCRTHQHGEVCAAGSLDYIQSDKSSNLLTGLHLGYALNDRVSAGINLGHMLVKTPSSSYRGNTYNTGAGAWAEWYTPLENGGWYLNGALSGSAYRADVHTPDLSYSDQGKGRANIKGWSFSVEAGRELNLNSETALKWFSGLSHDNIERSKFKEKGNAFPFSYAKTRYQLDSVYAGAEVYQHISDKLGWITSGNMERTIHVNEPEFRANETYVGNLSSRANIHELRWQLSSGLEYRLKNSTRIRFIPYLRDSALGTEAYGVNMSLEGKF